MRRLRHCCEDPAPEGRPAKVSPFQRQPARRGPAADGPDHAGAGPRHHDQGGRPVRPRDSDLPLPLIPPGLNEGFGLW